MDLLVDTNLLIHLQHPTGNAEAGLTRQLLDWDRAGHIHICVSSVSGYEQDRTLDMLLAEMDMLALASDRLIEWIERPDTGDLLAQINRVLGHRKQGDHYDALIVYAALDWARQGQETLLVTGDRNILRHADQLQALGVPPVLTLRSAVKSLKLHFPLTIVRIWDHA